MREAVIVSIVTVAGLAGVPFVNGADFAHTITPGEETHTAIGETVYRVHLYIKKHGTIPASLSVLPKRKGYANRITDAWNRELIYSVNEDGVLTLASYGKDGVAGGIDDDRDISKRYRTKGAQGKSIVDNPFWIEDAEIRQEF